MACYKAILWIYLIMCMMCHFVVALPIDSTLSTNETVTSALTIPSDTSEVYSTTSAFSPEISMITSTMAMTSSVTMSTKGHGSSSISPVVTSSRISTSKTSSSMTSTNQRLGTSDVNVTPKPGGSNAVILKGVSIGLGALCFIVILAFIMTILVLCRLRGQLKRMRDTLYPPTIEGEHVYTELITSNRKSDKNLKVELKPIERTGVQDTVDDEEIHSPMSPDPPPIVHSFRNLTTEKTLKHSQSVISVKSDKSIKLTSSETSEINVNHAYGNDGFDNDNESNTKNEFAKQKSLYDEGDLYEDYYNQTDRTQASVADDTALENNISSKMEQLTRQSSLSGLPEAVIQRVNSQLGADGMPLQDIDEDFTTDFDSGIPMTGMSTGLPDQLTFQDGDTYENTESTNSNSPKEQFSDTMKDEAEDIPVYEEVDMTDGESPPTKDQNTDVNNTNTCGIDLFPSYEDSGEGMTDTDGAGDFQLEYTNEALINHFDVNLSNEPDFLNLTTSQNVEIKTEAALDSESNFAVLTQMPSFPGFLDATSSQKNQEANGRLPYQENTNTVTEPPVDTDPLGLFKKDPFRIRSDSSSTPDNYYLDLEDVTSELKVEESKRVSSQFPSDFYVKNMENFGRMSPTHNNNLANQLGGSMSSDPFGVIFPEIHSTDNGHVAQTNRRSGDMGILHEQENPLYTNVILAQSKDPFESDSSI